MEIDGRSKKQFMAFGGLRKGIPKDKTHYSIVEVNDLLFDDIMNVATKSFAEDEKMLSKIPDLFQVDKQQAEVFFAGYKELINKILVEVKGLPVKVTNDQNIIELPHESFESIPLRLKELVIDKVKTIFKWDSTHLHIGIPAKIGVEASEAIARAVEARIILEHAISFKSSKNTLYATSYSTLRGSVESSAKRAGVIRFNYSRHSVPIEMNDLEVRNYLNIREGMNHIALAGILSRFHKSLRIVNDVSALSIVDPTTSNLNGALKYIGKIFIMNENPEKVSLGRQMLDYGRELETQGQIEDSMRVEISNFLKENNILELLTAEVFLAK